MLDILKSRLKQKYRTMPFPSEKTVPVDRFRGNPVCNFEKCNNNCKLCSEVCPTGAIEVKNGVKIDLGKCLFCNACADVCPEKCINFTNDYKLAVQKRQDLIIGRDERILKAALNEKIRKLFKRSLKLRQVCAGGCNACEADTNVLTTIGYDLGRFGIQFVASPRHADGILVTGPVSQNMRLALEKTYAAVPDPKIVIAVGTCAISGGIFHGHSEVCNGVSDIIPVDLFIPGCPPHPLTILDGFLSLLGRL